jgi:hypothetical protein
VLQHSLPAGTATRVPVTGSIGASVQPCTRFGTGYGGWVWLRPHSPPAGSNPEPLLRGQPRRGRGDGHYAGVLGFRVDCRSRRVVSDVRRESAVVAVPPPRQLAERLRSIGEQARRLVRQRRSGSALGRSSSSEGAPRPQARAPRSRGESGRRHGDFAVAVAKPVTVEEPGTPEARRADAPPEENAGAANAPRVEAGEAA